jgi:ubiquinone/menaquinone biosynthesis C-methylase UbiE
MEVPDYLKLAVASLDLGSDSEVLDVAAGTGLLFRAVSPRVGRVVALDITPEMLAEGRPAASREGITNIAFEQGWPKTCRIPTPRSTWSSPVSRCIISGAPEVVLGETIRVCRPKGKVLVADLVSPADEELAARYNELERLRDGTHSRALSPSGLEKLVADAGVSVTGCHSVYGEEDLEA